MPYSLFFIRCGIPFSHLPISAFNTNQSSSS
jgi:hypothetical protein